MMSFSKTVWLLFGLCCLTLTLAVAVYFYRDHYRGEKRRADEAVAQTVEQQRAFARLQRQQHAVTETDQKYTQELSKANETIEKLRADLSAGRKRLYVKASCPKLPETTTSPGLDNAARAELARNAEQDYLRLRQQLIKMQKQLETLQDYINKIN